MELVAGFDPLGIERADIFGEHSGLCTQIGHGFHRVAERGILLATALRLLIACPQTLPQARPHCPHHGQVDLAKAQPGLQLRLVEHLAFVQHAGERQDLRPRRHVEQSRAIQLLRPALTVETDEVGRGRLRAKAQEPG